MESQGWDSKKRRIFRRKFPFVACLILSLGISACGKDEPSETRFDVGDCGPADQRESYFIPVEAQVAKLWMAGFLPEEENAVSAATREWNSKGGAQTGGRVFFEPTHSSQPYTDPSGPSSKSDCDAIPGDGGEFYVMKTQNEARWRALGLNSSNAAVTLRCYLDDRLSRQIVLVNTNYVGLAQIQSVVLHELGHTLGLDHSCDDENKGSEAYAACATLPQTHSYYQAVMYPFLRIGMGEKKEILQSNDLQRAQCLYK